jgi:hypothetical protein
LEDVDRALDLEERLELVGGSPGMEGFEDDEEEEGSVLEVEEMMVRSLLYCFVKSTELNQG